MLFEPDVSGAAIALVGSFHPITFTPDWLIKNELIGAEQAAATDITVISPDLTILDVGSANLKIQRDRFEITTSSEPFISIADLTGKTFTELLPHAPIAAFGINRFVHFRTSSEATRSRVGRILAPTDPWGAWGEEIENSPLERRGGLRTLTMQKTREPAEFIGWTVVTVEPSALIPGRIGIYAALNDHYEVPEKKTVPAEIAAAKILDSFDDTVKMADAIFTHLAQLAHDNAV